MGGAAVGGNVTPAAEFNVYADPEAADIVFHSGLDVTMCGLDVTVPAYLTADELDELGALGSRQAKFARDVSQGLLAYSKGYGLPGMCMHDPLALFYADDETLLKTERAGVRVEMNGKLTRGKTVTDLYSDKKMEKNACRRYRSRPGSVQAAACSKRWRATARSNKRTAPLFNETVPASSYYRRLYRKTRERFQRGNDFVLLAPHGRFFAARRKSRWRPPCQSGTQPHC